MTDAMTPEEQPRRISVLRRTAASVLALTALVGAAALYRSGGDLSELLPDQSSQLRRRLSEALPNGGCFVTPAVAAPPEIKPVFAASYPGSGARMTWNLIEALTGIITGDDWNSNGWGKKVVSVKTHWPHPHGKRLDWENEIERAFVVIRNPIKAIPSFHNFLFEYQNNLENHSLRAPVDEWIRWRDQGFLNEIKEWRKHIEYYLDRYPADKRLVVPYEDLTSEAEGPNVSKQLIRFLGQGPGVNPISEESAPCVWGTVVNYQSGKKYNTRKPLDRSIQYVGAYPIWPGSKRQGDKDRPLTQKQIDEVIEMLQDVKIKCRDMGETNLQNLMQRYINEVRQVKADPRTAATLPLPVQQQPPAAAAQLAQPNRPGGPVPTAAETLAQKGTAPKGWNAAGVVQATV